MEMRKGMPEVGEKIKTPDGYARVVDTNILENIIKTRLYIEEKTDSKGKGKDKNPEEVIEPEEKLSTEIYIYKKQDIKRIEKRKDRNIFEGVDADTLKEIEQLIKD